MDSELQFISDQDSAGQFFHVFDKMVPVEADKKDVRPVAICGENLPAHAAPVDCAEWAGRHLKSRMCPDCLRKLNPAAVRTTAVRKEEFITPLSLPRVKTIRTPKSISGQMSLGGQVFDGKCWKSPPKASCEAIQSTNKEGP